MKLSLGKIIAILVVVVILLGAAGAAGVYVYRQQRIAQWLEDGNRYFDEGVYNLAKASYGLYLQNNPEDKEILRKYAESCKLILEDRRFSLSQAATALHQSLRHTDASDPDRAEMVKELIGIYDKVQAWGDLLFFVEQELVTDPDLMHLRMARARCHYNLGRFIEAEEYFTEICQEPDAPVDAYGYLAALLYDQQLNVKAESVLNEAIANRPDNCEIYVKRAEFNQRRGQADEALADLDKAIEINEDCVPALVDKAIMLADLRKFEESAVLAERAVNLDPEYSKTYTVISHVLQRTGRMEDAATFLENMDPYVQVDRPTTMLALMEIQLALDRIDDAHDTIDRYISSYPTHTLVKDYFEGRIAIIEERYDDAIETLGIVFSEQPRFAPAQFFLISAHLQAGQREEARTVLEQYMRAYPRDQRAQALLAREFGRYLDPENLQVMARDKLDDPLASAEELVATGAAVVRASQQARLNENTTALAIDLFREAIRRDPTHGEAYRAIADLYTSQDRFEEARSAMDEARQAGVPQTIIALSEANIELREGNLETATRIMTDDIESADVERRVGWAAFFMTRMQFDIAQQALDAARDLDDDAFATRIEIEQGRLYARSNKYDEALETINAIEATDDEAELLNQIRGEVAAGLLQVGGADRIAQATALADAMIEDNPENMDAQLLKVNTLIEQSPPDYDGARALLTEVLADDAGSPQALFAMSNLAMAEGKLEEALEHAKQLVIVAPAYAPGQMRLAEVHIAMNNLVDAEAALETALDTLPDTPEIISMLAQVYMRVGQGRNAETALRKLQSFVGREPAWQERLATLDREYRAIAGEAKEAEAELRTQYESDPSRLDYAIALADNLVRQTRTEDAIELVRTWADDHPGEAEGWNSLARLYLIQPDRDGLWNASTALTRSLVVDPENLNALREMVDVQSKLNNYPDAILLADRFLSIRPNDSEMLYDKASFISRDRQRLEESVAIVSEAIALKDDPRYRGLRGIMQLELGNYGAALEDLEIAAQARGVSSGQLDLALAEGYLGVAKFDLAHRYYDLAVEKAKQGESLSSDRLDRVEDRLRTDE